MALTWWRQRTHQRRPGRLGPGAWAAASVALAVARQRTQQRRPGLLRESPRFRYLWLSRTISATGTGVSRVALVLLVSSSGPGAVSLVLLCSTLPQLLGPLAGAVADRVEQRRLLAGCEAGQGIIYAVVAIAHPTIAALLPLVTDRK